jgi:uncharacterized protein
MALYLDSSALVKLIVDEEGSDDLRLFIGEHKIVSSQLAHTELVRAVRRAEPGRLEDAEALIDDMTLFVIDRPLAERAARVEPGSLRSLDAIHVATAAALDADLDALVTYDRQMVNAARLLGMRVASPGDKSA